MTNFIKHIILNPVTQENVTINLPNFTNFMNLTNLKNLTNLIIVNFVVYVSFTKNFQIKL